MISLARVWTKLHSLWLGNTYPFPYFGKGVSIHHTCEMKRAVARKITIGDSVYLAASVWMNVVGDGSLNDESSIRLGNGCQIGRGGIISAKNSITLEEHVLLGPSVLIMDHNHGFCDPNEPISSQGTTVGGRIIIGKNCWIGHGAAIICGRGELVIGHNCVVGANAVVTKSVPACSVIVGNPGRIVKTYDPGMNEWVSVNGTPRPMGCAEPVRK
jgi:acetyltransferase-like isoleucine patch superfamily enzyme